MRRRDLFAIAAEPRPTGTVAHNMIAVKGMQRTFIVYTPKSLKPNAPLVFVFHGSGGDGESMRDATGFEFDMLADRDGFALGAEILWIEALLPFHQRPGNHQHLGR